MDLAELKEKHPVLYAALFALGVTEGEKAGKLTEQARVEAHLISGKASGSVKGLGFALECIANGTPYDGPVVMAKYAAFATTSNALAARGTEDGQLADAGTPEADDADKKKAAEKDEREMLARVATAAGGDVSKITGLAEPTAAPTA